MGCAHWMFSESNQKMREEGEEEEMGEGRIKQGGWGKRG